MHEATCNDDVTITALEPADPLLTNETREDVDIHAVTSTAVCPNLTAVESKPIDIVAPNVEIQGWDEVEGVLLSVTAETAGAS